MAPATVRSAGVRPGTRRPPSSRPFTLEHFKAWAADLVLDTGRPWVLEPFQAAFVRDVFRGVPECWLVIPEGNGKTTLVAGLALYHCRYKPSAWVPVAASSREQAEIAYRQAEGFVIRTPRLQPVFKCLEGYRRIRCDEMGSRIQVFAADDRTGDGVIPTLCVVDELHRHHDLRLYRTWRGKLEKRGGQIVTISTAGEPGSEFEETRERIRQSATDVRRQETFLRAASPNLVLHEWALPEKGDIDDLRLVKRANPFSGVTIAQLARKRESPTMTDQHWRRFVCNLPTRGERAAIQEAEWHRAATTERIPPGEPVWLGLDVAWKWDTTAAVPLWIRDHEFRLLGPAEVLIPPRDGSSMDPHRVEHMLTELHHRNPIHTVVMDMTRAEQLSEWIRAELGAEIIDRTQSRQAAALDYERFMEALREGWLRHCGDAGLTRHALNAIARPLPAGGACFERPAMAQRTQEQDRRVIDALIAAAMVHATAAATLKVEEAEPMLAFL
jgi:phage terminase large subunit-like protein